jgi:predicted Zn-dependent protease
VNTKCNARHWIPALCTVAIGAMPALAETLPDSEALMRALADELARSMTLQMEDLEKPYFIQYTVDDSISHHLTASYGAITGSQRERSRDFYSQTRVGSYDLDNTNFVEEGGGFFAMFGGRSGSGGRASLPLDDDYKAIRQAIWWATDQDYKDAVETLTKKRAYMRDKTLEDRPNDFSKAPVVEYIEPTASMDFDKAAWTKKLEQASAHFKKYPQIQDSSIQLYAMVGNAYTVNSEGTRLRVADTGALLVVSAELQAEDGEKLSDSWDYYGRTPGDLPALDRLTSDIDTKVALLTKVAAAPILERYTGPVLFDGVAAPKLFRTMLAEQIAGRVDPVGTQRADVTGAGSFEKKLEQRVLPRSFQMYDDPTVPKIGDTALLGHYRYDDEGVLAKRTDLVKDGTFESMVLSRVPTKKQSGSNGHGRRSPGSGSAQAAIANLFIVDEDGLDEAALKRELLTLVEEEGLEYGLRVASIRTAGIGSSQSDLFAMFMRMQQRGGRQGVGDPIYAYKVYPDGREELVRGLEFGQIKARDLKQIAAGGTTPTVYNYIGIGFGGATPATSIVAPAVLFEELELSKIEEERDKPPILATPIAR